MKEDNDKAAYKINTTLILCFGIISILNSIFILFSTFFVTSYELVLMELLSRIILAGIFLAIGLGSLLFLRRSISYNEKDDFWDTMKDMHTCLSAEEKLNSLGTSETKQLCGIKPEAEKEQGNR